MEYNKSSHQWGVGNPSQERGGSWGNIGGRGGQGRGGGAQFGITSYQGRGNGEREPWGDDNEALIAQGRDRAREHELQAQRTANVNLRTRVGMLEATLKGCEEKESKKDAVYARDRMEGNNLINQTRAKLGQSEKKVSDLNKELEEKQLLLSGLNAEKVHAVNKDGRRTR